MEKDILIYQEIANVAAAVFDSIVCPAGKYTPADIAKYVHIDETKKYDNTYHVYKVTGIKYSWLKDSPFSWAADYDPLQKHAVSVDTFSCTFNSWGVFSVLKKIAAAWNVPTAYRAQLIRKTETGKVAVSFSVPVLCKDIVKIPQAVAKDKTANETYKYVAVDTRRRAIVATNGNIISAVAVSDMFVSEDARPVYVISPELIKTGKGSVSIYENGNAANDTGVSVPVAENVFPRWERVLPAVQDAQAVEIGNKVFKQLKKEIAAAVKSANQSSRVIKLSGTAGNNYISVSAADIDFSKENTRRVSLPSPCPFDFYFPLHGPHISAVPVAEKIYLCGYTNKYSSVSYSGANLIFAAAGAFSLICPQKSADETITAPAADSETPAVDILKVCRFPDVPAADSETPAVAVPVAAEDAQPVANVQDEETPAAAAEDAQPVAADSVPAVWGRVDWIRAAHYMRIIASKFTYGRPYSDNSISQAVERLERLNIILKDNTFVWADSLHVISRIKKEMKKDICVSVEIVWLSSEEYAAQERETANVQDETPAVADSVPADSANVAVDEETPAVLIVCPADEETPAVAAADSPRRARRRFRLRPWLRNAAAVAVLIVCAVLIGWERETPAAAAEDAQPVPAVAVFAADSVSQETANVQDEETPAAAADSANVAADSPAVAVADSVPAVAKISPRRARRGRARRADSPAVPVAADSVSADSVSTFAADSVSVAADSVSVAADSLSLPAVADSLSFAAVAADSLSFAADSVSVPVAAADSLSAPAVPADSLSLPVADSLPADSVSTAVDAPDVPAAVQDEETPAAAADSVSRADSPAVAVPVAAADSPDVPAVADSVPAEDAQPVAADSVPAADSLSAPAVAVLIAPAVPVAAPYVIACEIIHPSQAAPAAGLVIGSAPNHWAALTL